MNKFKLIFALLIIVTFSVVGCDSPISLQQRELSVKAQIFLSNTSAQSNQSKSGGSLPELQNVYTSFEVQFFGTASSPIRTLSFNSGDSVSFDTTGLGMTRFVRVIAEPTGEAIQVTGIKFPGGGVQPLLASQKLSNGFRVGYGVDFQNQAAIIAPGISTLPGTLTNASSRYVQYRITPATNPSGSFIVISGTEGGSGKNWRAYRVGTTSQFALFVLENGQADSANGYLSAIRFTSPQLSAVQVENVNLVPTSSGDWRHGIYSVGGGLQVRQPGSAAQTINGGVSITFPVSISVTSASTGFPISGANVSLGSFSATTGSTGISTLSVPQGTYQLSVTANGFTSINRSEQIISGTNIINVVLDSIQTPPPPSTSGARIFLDSTVSTVIVNNNQRQVRKLYIDSLLFNGFPIVSGARVDIENADLISAFEALGWTESVTNSGFRRTMRAVTENGRKIIYFPVTGSGSYRYVLRSSDNTVTVDFTVVNNTTIRVNNTTVNLRNVRAVTNPDGTPRNYEFTNLL